MRAARTSPKQQLCGTSQNHAKLGICVGVRRCSGGPRQETVSSRLLSMMDVCALLAFCLLTLAHTITSTKVQIFLQPPLLVCPSSSNAAEATLLERDFHCFFVGDALFNTTGTIWGHFKFAQYVLNTAAVSRNETVN